MALVASSKLGNFRRALSTLFFAAYNKGAGTAYQQLIMPVRGAIGDELVLAWLGAVPGMEKLVDEAKKRNLQTSDWTIKNDEFASTVAVKAIDILRDNEGVYSPFASAMGEKARIKPLLLMTELLLTGHTAKDYTGKAFFAANKTAWKGAKTFSNSTTKKLSRDNFKDAVTNIRNRVDALGDSMFLGSDLHLVVAPKNEWLAREILEDKEVAGGGTNTTKGAAKLLVLPSLAAGANANEEHWSVHDLGSSVKPFVESIEMDVKFLKAENEDTEEFIKSHTYSYQFWKTGNVAYGMPELSYGSDGSTAA